MIAMTNYVTRFLGLLVPLTNCGRASDASCARSFKEICQMSALEETGIESHDHDTLIGSLAMVQALMRWVDFLDVNVD